MSDGEERVAEPAAIGDVIVHTSDAVATLILDRPARLNAFDRALRLRLLETLRRVEADPEVRAIVITGSGSAFSSGSDIDTFEGSDSGDVLRNEYRPIITCIRAMPKPVIAAVRGVAAGAGASVALACDLVVMGATSRFDLSFIRLGLVPDAGLTWHLVHALGRARATELAWQGGTIGAADALSWGLVNRVVPDDEVLTSSERLASELANGPTVAIAAAKRLIEDAVSTDPDEMLEREAATQERLRRGAEHVDRLAAWFARHPRRS